MFHFKKAQVTKIIILCTLLTTMPIIGEGFLAGTLISTPNGLRAIETLHPGDVVISRTFFGKPTAGKITKITCIQTKTFVELVIQGQKYFVGNDQKLYLEGKYRSFKAHTLHPADIVVGVHGQRGRIKEVHLWQEEQPIKLHTLSVARYHNFCIGQTELIAHNMTDYDMVFKPRPLLFAASGGLLLSSPAVVAIYGGILCGFAINLLMERIQEINKNNHLQVQPSAHNNNRNNNYYRSFDDATHVRGFADLPVTSEVHGLAQIHSHDKVPVACTSDQNKQTATRVAFDRQRESLNQISDEWQQVQDIYQEYNLCDDGRYERRRQALSSMTNNGCVYETKSYTVSLAATQLIHDMGTDITEYQTCYGNQLQQVIHQECIEGIDRLASLLEISVVHPYKESLAFCFDAAREYNQAGAVDKATAVADFCWSLLDYGKAIVEGAVAGVVGAIEDMIEHPGQALLCAVAGEYVLAYQLSKVLYNVLDIGVTYAFDAERGKQQWDECVAPVTQLIDAIANKELSLRDGLKGATQLAVQWKAQGKLLKGMNKFCKTAKTKALEFAKNNPLTTPEQYMITPEGILLQSTQNIQPLAASGSSGPRLIKREQILPQVQTYEQARNKALEIIGDVDPHTAEPHIGRVGIGEGRITGIDWQDGKVCLRLDWDPTKKAHINVTDYRLGKGSKAIEVAIPFVGDEATVESLLKHLNTKPSIDTAIEILKQTNNNTSLDLLLYRLQREQ